MRGLQIFAAISRGVRNDPEQPILGEGVQNFQVFPRRVDRSYERGSGGSSNIPHSYSRNHFCAIKADVILATLGSLKAWVRIWRRTSCCAEQVSLIPELRRAPHTLLRRSFGGFSFLTYAQSDACSATVFVDEIDASIFKSLSNYDQSCASG